MAYVGEGGLTDIKRRLIRMAGSVTLPANGLVDITFDPPVKRPDDAVPVVIATAIDDPGSPVIVQTVEKFQNAQGEWTGARLQAARMVALPETILNVGQLSGFIVAQQSGLEGVQVDWVAI